MAYDPRKLDAECHRCPLRDRTPVPPAHSADPDHPKLIIVGMNPGKLEENRGIPFIGPSGRMLDKLLDEANFDRSEAHVTNAAMCASAEDKDIKRAVACCAPRLAREIGGFAPDIPILALGGEATRQVLGRAGVHKARGFVWKAPEIKPSQISNAKRLVERRVAFNKDQEKIQAAKDSLALIKGRQVYAGRTVFPTVHPAFILRGADGYLPVLRIDIRRAVRWVQQGGFPLEDEIAGLNFTQTNDARLAKKLLAKMGKLVNVDIETDGNDPMDVAITCVGVADVDYIRRWDQRRIAALAEGKKAPRFDKRRVLILDPWEDRLEAVLREALGSRRALTHNGPAFDNIALGRRGIRFGVEDTLIAHNAFASDKPKALAHVASIYTNSSPWKIKFKQGSEEKGVAGFGVKKEDLARYNAADVVLGSLAWIRMQPDLEPERKVYEHDLRHAQLVAGMQVRGLFVDQPRMKALSKKLKHRAAALLGEMRSLLRRKNFNPNKPIHIRNALFRQLKAPTYLGELTPTGLPSTAAAVLETLKQGKNRAGVLADLIIRYRSAKDARAEYLDNVKVFGDGRVRPHWRSYGTVTGRPATRNPNILNITRIQYCPGCSRALLDGMAHGSPEKPCNPKRRKEPQPEEQLRDIYIAPEGHDWVYFDLSQCEMRFAAAISGDPVFMRACEKDVHAENAKVLFAGIEGALEDLKDPKGAGKRFRDIAKNCGFAISYLAEADKLFEHLLENGFDIDIDICQDAIDRIHEAYARYYEWAYENIALCRRQGYLRTPFLGRKRWMGKFPKPTEIPPFLISGGVADVMNERLWAISQKLPRGVSQILYQYDSAIYEVPQDTRVDETQEIIKSVWSTPIVVPATGVKFMQPIDLKTGRRWSSFG